MCPHCGELFARLANSLVPIHDDASCGTVCPGSGQTPRNPRSDMRPLWNGERSPAAREDRR
jgi:hypothetical protein